MRCIHDQGGEFLRHDFTTTIEANSIKLAALTTVKNPQANIICKRAHQLIGNTLRTMLLVNPPNSILDADELTNSVLATTMHAIRASLNRSLVNISLGALALFHCDMMPDIPLIPKNWSEPSHLPRWMRVELSVGADLIVIRNWPRQAIGTQGAPRSVHQPVVFVNGTLTIRLNAHTVEFVSTRLLRPYQS
jgi:hypothetical protein